MQLKLASTPPSDAAEQAPRGSVGAARRAIMRTLRLISTTGALSDRGIPAAAHMRLDPLLLGAAVLINLLGLALPLSVLQVYDRIAPNGATETLIVLGVGLIGVAIAEFILRIAQGFVASLSAARFGQTLQTYALERLLWAPASRMTQRSESELLDQLNAIDRLTDFYGGQARLAIVDLPFALVFLLTIAVIGGPLALVPVVVFSLFLIGVFQLGGKVKEITHERDQQERKAADFVSEMLSGIATVKSFALEPLMMRRYERLLKTTADQQRDNIALAGDMQRISAVFGAISIVATLGAGALLVIGGDLTIGGLAACSLLSSRAIQPILRAARTWSDLQRAALATDDVAKLFELPSAPAFFQTAPAQAPSVVECRNVFLSVEDRAILNGATMRLEPGVLAALAGPAGSGRTTFLRLAAGLLEPDSGEFLVDGAPALMLRRASDQRVCYISVSAPTFAGTILQNLTLFGRGASPEEARWAAELIGLDQSVNKLQRGYETVLGGGVAETLPAGLTRTIVLARAIAQRPRLLLLDEPHVFLDTDGEARLLSAMRELRKESTILFTTSRQAHIRQADQLFIARDGKLIERAPATFHGDMETDVTPRQASITGASA